MLKTTVRVGLPKKEGEEERRWIYIKNAGLEMIRAAVTGRGLGLNGTDEGVLVEVLLDRTAYDTSSDQALYGQILASTRPLEASYTNVVSPRVDAPSVTKALTTSGTRSPSRSTTACGANR